MMTLARCGDLAETVDIRDRALLLIVFASGGRRRSAVAGLRVEQFTGDQSVPLDPKLPSSPELPCLSMRLGRTKPNTTGADTDAFVLLIGRPASALKEWLKRAGISESAVSAASTAGATSNDAR